jgi:SAM-dependent methyltransferase
MIMSVNNPTRGDGLLESLLAQLRANKANSLIRDELRAGRILDIGCGSYPYFLSHTYFAEKFAVDKMASTKTENIRWYALDLNSTPYLPFDGHYFNVVTMLAVTEHLNPDSLVVLFKEIHRVLKPGGLLILTTPASWADGLLHLMAHIHLVSKEEIHEHVYAYSLPLLGWYFGSAGFPMTKVRFGYFEFGLNLWGVAER